MFAQIQIEWNVIYGDILILRIKVCITKNKCLKLVYCSENAILNLQKNEKLILLYFSLLENINILERKLS